MLTQDQFITGPSGQSAPTDLRHDFRSQRLLTEQLHEAFRLRYKLLVEEWGWIPSNEDRLDTDIYDSKAEHFGVLDKTGTLIAYFRVLTGSLDSYMLEREFAFMIKPDEAARIHSEFCADTSLEISRLVISPGISREEKVLAIRLLYRELVAWAKPRRRPNWYMVATNRLRDSLLRQGFVLHVYAETDVIGGCVVACLDLHRTEENLRISFPKDWEFYFGSVDAV